jgi:transposase-like protein
MYQPGRVSLIGLMLPLSGHLFGIRLKKCRIYTGIHTDSFLLFSKEREFGFNYGTPKQQPGTLMLWGDI